MGSSNMSKRNVFGYRKLMIFILTLILITLVTVNTNIFVISLELQERRLPSVLIIGVKKCGTRALLEYINMHPAIVMAPIEIHYFDKPAKYNTLGLDWYREQMPLSYYNQITVEKTPNYYNHHNASDLIYKMSKDTRLLIIVREPITRMLSDYVHFKFDRMKKNLPYGNLSELILTKKGEINNNSRIVRYSMYVNNIDNWLDKFPLHQIHFIDGEKLITDPYAEMILVERFLNLKRFFIRDHFVYDFEKGFYCMRSDPSENLCLEESKGRKHPPISKQLLEQFIKLYEPYNEAFFNKIKRKFDWNSALKRIEIS